jgi:hypothetical protein
MDDREEKKKDLSRRVDEETDFQIKKAVPFLRLSLSGIKGFGRRKIFLDEGQLDSW